MAGPIAATETDPRFCRATLHKLQQGPRHRTSANERLINQFKQTILEGFPWDTIEKKKQLIADYIDEHGKLLTFYDKNWGSWKTGTKAGKPEFNSPTATNIYNKLRDQIVNTGNEIEQQYKTMSE